MKTRALFFTMLFVSISCGIFAQQEKPVHYTQVGLNFSSLNSFGIHYKTGGEKTLLRLTLLSLNLGQTARWGRPQDSIDIKNQSYGVGFRLGFEKRVPVVARFDFIWGLEAGCNYNYQKQKLDQIYYTNNEIVDWSITPIVDLILGATYTISDHLVIGAEILPHIQYSYGKTKSTNYVKTTETTNSVFSLGFSNNSASLSIAYRFGK